MVSLRDLGTIPLADLQANNIDWSFFLRLDFASGPGTQRFTDRACGATGSYTGSIDGSSQTWTERGLRVPYAAQSRNGLLDVSFFTIDNLDNTFSGWAQSGPGMRGVPVTLYIAWFSSAGALDGSYIGFKGITDDGLYRSEAQVTLKPGSATPWGKRMLGAPVGGPVCPYIFKDPDTCQYAGGNTNCSHTRSTTDGCGVGFNNNLSRFGGDDMAPKPGTTITFGVTTYESNPGVPFYTPDGWTPPASTVVPAPVGQPIQGRRIGKR